MAHRVRSDRCCQTLESTTGQKIVSIKRIQQIRKTNRKLMLAVHALNYLDGAARPRIIERKFLLAIWSIWVSLQQSNSRRLSSGIETPLLEASAGLVTKSTATIQLYGTRLNTLTMTSRV